MANSHRNREPKVYVKAESRVAADGCRYAVSLALLAACHLGIAATTGTAVAPDKDAQADVQIAIPAADTIATPEQQPSERLPLAGIAQRISLQEFEPAERELTAKIDDIESSHHRYHPSLIEPLSLLGDARLGQNNLPGALDAYGRAVHLTRVSSGLHSPDQIPVVRKQARTFEKAGDLQQANSREEYAWEVLQKAHGPYAAELLPGIYHLANWYERNYNIFAARSLYMRAIRIVEANFDEQHPALVPALKNLAKTYRLEKYPPFYVGDDDDDIASFTPSTDLQESSRAVVLNRFPSGEKALKRLLRIRRDALAKLEAEHPDNSDAIRAAELELAQAMIEMGDWYLLFDKSRTALQFYALAREYNLPPDTVDFSYPLLLHTPAPGDPPPPRLKYRGQREQGFVEVQYSITARGTVVNLKTIASEPPGLMDYRVRKSIRATRYRPMFVDGAPTTKENHRYRHEFNYYPRRGKDNNPGIEKSDEQTDDVPMDPTGPTAEPAEVDVAVDAEISP